MARGNGAGPAAGEGGARLGEDQAGLAGRRRLRRAVALASTLGLLGLVVLAALAWPKPPASTLAGGSSVINSATSAQADRVEVVYFHRTQRCETCLWSGQAARWTVSTYFADELSSGKVTFQEVDVQKPENAPLANRFRATGSSLFLNYEKDDQDHIVQAADTYPYAGNLERYSEQPDCTSQRTGSQSG